MPDETDISMIGANHPLVVMFQVGRIVGDLDQLVRPAGRPMGGLVVRYFCKPGCDKIHEQTFLASWQHLSQLFGQLHGFREMLPPHLVDQFDADAKKLRQHWLDTAGSVDV